MSSSDPWCFLAVVRHVRLLLVGAVGVTTHDFTHLAAGSGRTVALWGLGAVALWGLRAGHWLYAAILHTKQRINNLQN